tara:strand:- start:504 stop:1430 length:927 start_codon:yes stop_codon:yes gene_type:complete
MSTKDFIKNSINIANTANQFTREAVTAGVGSAFCSNIDERIPEFDKAPCEKISQGNHNAFVVLGRDRYASWTSGNGGKGLVQCGMIDLVAGRGQLIIANNKKEKKDPMAGVEFVGPMFHSDAARVYITQKAEDIDKYFGLKPSGGPTSQMKSAVASKADQIRIIGREKVRIYAGRGNFEGFDSNVGETNSIGERLRGQVIELQVGNQELHPMVKGNKIVEYLKGQQKINRKMYRQLLEINTQLATINGAISVMTAGAPPFSKFTFDNIANINETIGMSLNSIIQTINYLDNDLIPGQEHILSDSVFTT